MALVPFSRPGRRVTGWHAGRSRSAEKQVDGLIDAIIEAEDPMDERPIDEDGLPFEIDFSKGIRGLHHSPSAATILTPDSGRQGNTPVDPTDELKADADNQ